MNRFNRKQILLTSLITLIIILTGYVSPVTNLVFAETNPFLTIDKIFTAQETTPTPNPDACDMDCIDPELSATHTESMPGFSDETELDDQRLNLVFYWMEGCPQCETVIQTTLPELEEEFGDVIVIHQVELKTIEDVNQLYTIGEEYGFEKENIGTPFMIIGGKALSGKEQIQSQAVEEINAVLNLSVEPSNTQPKIILIISAISLVLTIGVAVLVFQNKNRKTKLN